MFLHLTSHYTLHPHTFLCVGPCVQWIHNEKGESLCVYVCLCMSLHATDQVRELVFVEVYGVCSMYVHKDQCIIFARSVLLIIV